VLWLVPSAAVEEPLRAAIAAVDPEAELMAVERLPADLLRYAGPRLCGYRVAVTRASPPGAGGPLAAAAPVLSPGNGGSLATRW
jgi:hypothetical protein